MIRMMNQMVTTKLSDCIVLGSSCRFIPLHSDRMLQQKHPQTPLHQLWSYRSHLTDVILPPTNNQNIDNPRLIVLMEDYGMKHGLLNETDRTFYKAYKTLVPESGHALVYFRLLRKVRKERYWESNYVSAREEFSEDIVTLTDQHKEFSPVIIARGPESSWITMLYEMEDPKPRPLAGIVMIDPLEIDMNDNDLDPDVLEFVNEFIEVKRKKRDKLRALIKLGKIKPEEDEDNIAGFDVDLDMDLMFWKKPIDPKSRPPPCPKFIVSTRWDKEIEVDPIDNVADDFRWQAQIMGKRFGAKPDSPLPILKMEPTDPNYGSNLLQTVCQWIQDPQSIQSMAVAYDKEKPKQQKSKNGAGRKRRKKSSNKTAFVSSDSSSTTIAHTHATTTSSSQKSDAIREKSETTSQPPLKKRKDQKQKLRTRRKRAPSTILGDPDDIL